MARASSSKDILDGASSDDSDDDELKMLRPALSPALLLVQARFQSILAGPSILLTFVHCLRAEMWDQEVTSTVCSFLSPMLANGISTSNRIAVLNGTPFFQAFVHSS